MKLLAFSPPLVALVLISIIVNTASLVSATTKTARMNRDYSRKALSDESDSTRDLATSSEDYERNKMGSIKGYPDGGAVPLPPFDKDEDQVKQSSESSAVVVAAGRDIGDNHKMGDVKSYPYEGSVPLPPPHNDEKEAGSYDIDPFVTAAENIDYSYVGNVKYSPYDGNVQLPNSYENEEQKYSSDETDPCRKLKRNVRRRRRIQSNGGCDGDGSEDQAIDEGEDSPFKLSSSPQEANKMGNPSEYPLSGAMLSPTKESSEQNKIGNVKNYPNGGMVPLPPPDKGQGALLETMNHNEEQIKVGATTLVSNSNPSQIVEATESTKENDDVSDDQEVNKDESSLSPTEAEKSQQQQPHHFTTERDEETFVAQTESEEISYIKKRRKKSKKAKDEKNKKL
uniref:Uncharacterized protein n=1 Tax=Ditylum brightwellii TaxID=49249 RepID=A0A7S2A3Q4_9STRA|mmetsp:Transcript_7991/g.11960  ORF Transcript_7991/g.11960 Transcript_7991/m.11960 type:complete len:397 (+) Transcript_7991:213-1403(+)